MTIDIKTIKPYRGWLFGEVIGGDYETESGILVVKHVGRRNFKIDKFKVLAIGGPFMVYEKDEQGRIEDSWPGSYDAKVGQIAYMKRGTAKPQVINGKKYCFVKNEDIVGAEDATD